MVIGIILKISEIPVTVGYIERPSRIAKVNGTDNRHFLIGQLKVENADVFENVVRIG